MPIVAAITAGVELVTGFLKNKHEIAKAAAENKARMLRDEQNYNQLWEMKQLDNSGWKDEVLFYSFILLFVWSGFDPEGAGQFFKNIDLMPEWFKTTWMWLVASVIGVKKLGDYAPPVLNAIKEVIKK